MTKKELISEIIGREWPMFAAVENQGGKASCQSRPVTFEIMRSSQYLSWPENVLGSYLRDLKRAALLKRNLCAEKYAYMMAFTAPAEYEKIASNLPAVKEETLKKIREIVDINIAWEEAADRKYPRIRSKGRPLKSSQDTQGAVSVETYLLCELKTYSPDTIDMLHAYTLECKKKGINLAERTLENTVMAYGYKSLEEAENDL